MKGDDWEIMRMMRRGKRLNMSEVARSLDFPVSTVSNRIKSIEKRHIEKRVSLLDFSTLGFNTHSFFILNVSTEKRCLVSSFLKDSENVNSSYRINSGRDFLVECVFRNIMEQRDWIDKIQSEYSAETESIPVLKIEGRENFLS